MLMPKRVKRRRVHRGRMKGVATKGNTITYGAYGLIAQECGWITSNQIEAARIAMTRSIKRGGKVYIKIFPHKSVTKKPAEVSHRQCPLSAYKGDTHASSYRCLSAYCHSDEYPSR